MINIIRAVFIVLVLLLLPNQSHADTQITNMWNVYSPTLLFQNGQLVMYFGGWDWTDYYYFANYGILPHDKIYRSVCSSLTSCSNPQIVIDPRWYGYMGSAGLFNDPTIVNMGSYLIMYMTGVASNDPNAGYYTPNDRVYFSTSWANDGVNWSPPQLLLTDIWTPSATVGPGGNVLVYGQSNSPGNTNILEYNLGTSGVNGVWETWVSGVPNSYSFNPNVTYWPQYGYYQMLTNGPGNQVNYLYSFDGWGRYWNYYNTPITSWNQITSPANYPSTYCWDYYGKSPANNGWYNIYFQPWC